MSELKILVVSNLQPHPAHSVRAANVVIYELVRALAKQQNVRCGFLHVRMEGDPEASDAENTGMAALAAARVDVLPAVTLPAGSAARSFSKQLLRPRRDDFYPQIRHAGKVLAAVESYRPDVLLIPWSEWLTGVCADFPVAKFAYYGNPDAKSARARLNFASAHGEVSRVQRLFSLWNLKSLERLHLRQMRSFEMLGDVAANDADYYSRHGHPNSFYVRNLWLDRLNGAWREMRGDAAKPGVIIGNVGKLGGTGNTLGMELLGRELLPRLRRRLPGRFLVRLLGAGDAHPAVRRLLSGDDVEFSGFVPDIDRALLDASLLLCLNNASDFKVGQTRYLHAWSLGTCVVAHKDAALSMPEMKHNENALLGGDMDEIADLVARAIADPALRSRIGEAGYVTFRELYTADKVAETILVRMRSYLGRKRPQRPRERTS